METVAGWLECCGQRQVGQECEGHQVRAAAGSAQAVGRSCGGAKDWLRSDQKGG